MKKLTILLLAFLTMSFSVVGQTYLDDIKVGQKMPQDINIGGFTEQNVENCSCRVFKINYDVSPNAINNGANEISESIGVHYDKNDTVTGIIKISEELTEDVAEKMYISDMSYFMRTQYYFKGRKIVKVRDSNHGVVDGIYYFIYSSDNGKIYHAEGFVRNFIIEETYNPNSNYKPRLVN